MSANIYWRPVENNWHSVGGKSALMNAIDKAIGWRGGILRLDSEHIGILKGIYACGIDGAQDLSDAIDTYGAIEIEYKS